MDTAIDTRRHLADIGLRAGIALVLVAMMLAMTSTNAGAARQRSQANALPNAQANAPANAQSNAQANAQANAQVNSQASTQVQHPTTGGANDLPSLGGSTQTGGAQSTAAADNAANGNRPAESPARYHVRIRLDDGRYRGYRQHNGDALRIRDDNAVRVDDRVASENDRIHLERRAQRDGAVYR